MCIVHEIRLKFLVVSPASSAVFFDRINKPCYIERAGFGKSFDGRPALKTTFQLYLNCFPVAPTKYPDGNDGQ